MSPCIGNPIRLRAASAHISDPDKAYLIGGFLVTIRFNVPLNDQLAALDPEQADIPPKWQAYIAASLPWNHVRTISSLASTAAFAVALVTMLFPSW